MRRNIDRVLVGYEHFSTKYRSADREELYQEAMRWSMDLDHKTFCTMEQVHGDAVHIAKRNQVLPQCDGLISADPDIVLMGTFADCVPIAFWDEAHNIGLCHAGWRGTAMRIGPKLMDMMHSTFGSKHIEVWIGPCICPKHYEVSPGFDLLSRPHSPHAFLRMAQKLYFDLVEENRAQVQSNPYFFGVHLDNACTFEHSQYHSHRRSGVERGRNVAFITQSKD